jgi:cation transport ATPase
MCMADHTLNIDGMTCASCVARVEKALCKVPGVQAASVNLATEQAQVSAQGETDPLLLLAAIQRAGYEASLVQADADGLAEPVHRRHDEGWKVAVAAGLSLPPTAQPTQLKAALSASRCTAGSMLWVCTSTAKVANSWLMLIGTLPFLSRAFLFTGTEPAVSSASF